jgi:hypothetical protein
MRVLQRSVTGKSPDQDLCEDVTAVTDHYAAVFDGAGGVGKGPEGSSGARFAANVLGDALLDLPPEADFAAAAAILSRALDDQLIHRVGAMDAMDRPFAVGVIFSSARREVWRLGDLHFAIDGHPHPGTLAIGQAPASFRALLLHVLLLSGKASVPSLVEHDPASECLAQITPEIHVLRNSERELEWGFGAFDGTPIPDRFLEVVPVPPDASELVLTSDGYPEPRRTLEEAEARLKELLEEDPLCIDAFRSEKGLRSGAESFDDRAYLRLAL